ncbi:hypothetical protein HMN09_00142500 [Mycena chlorophos]|uniref:Cytochrome P450 n=1 Tax=Mycena chlorophos TaxID=658473 RepID=A0A8H6WKB7_MYCCL|nr:hypothetical protein HMN09_00142500 [Mycena chlorophos]
MLPKELLVGTIALGLVNHAYLKRYEPKTAHWPLACLLLQPFALVAALRFLLPSSGISPTTTSVLICTSAFLLTLVSSIVAYRLSPWHRLAHIPGPMHRKVTKLFTVVEAVMGRRHLVLKDLHERYGDVVRVGPNDVSIVNADAVKAVLGSGGLPKSDNYHVFSDATLSSRNLLSLSGPEHANRRRVWNRGMSSAALKDYEVLLQPRLELLMERLDAFAKGKQEVDLAQWLSYLPADFMGDIAFGGGFELLRDGEDRDGIYTLIKLGVKAMSIQAQIPWIAPTLNLVPAALEILRRLHAFGAARAAERMKVGPKTHKDLWYHLMDEEGHEKTPPKLIDVLTDGAMTIVAGSDTTAMSLTAFMYCMLTNREMYSRARTEVDNVYPDAQAIFDSEKHDEGGSLIRRLPDKATGYTDWEGQTPRAETQGYPPAVALTRYSRRKGKGKGLHPVVPLRIIMTTIHSTEDSLPFATRTRPRRSQRWRSSTVADDDDDASDYFWSPP